MTLLSICQEIAEDVPVDSPLIIVGNSEDTARLLLSCCKQAGQYLAKRHDWVDMVKEHTFTTVASTQDYSLPSDFKFLIDQTLWDRSNYWMVRGPLNAQEWQERRSSILSSTVTTWKHFRIRDVSGVKMFSIDPIPDAADDLVFEYRSTSWCENAGGTALDTWGGDTDVGIIDENLIFLEARWRFLNRLGMSYAEEKEEARTAIDKTIALEAGARTLCISGRSGLRLIGPENVPDSGYGT